MAVQQQYAKYWQEIRKVGDRFNEILSETNPNFTTDMKLKKIANASRYFQKVVQALEQQILSENDKLKDTESEIDSPLIEVAPPAPAPAPATPQPQTFMPEVSPAEPTPEPVKPRTVKDIVK